MVVGQPTPPSTFLRDSSRGAGDRPRQGNPPISSDPKVDSKAPRGTDRVSQALVPRRLGDIFGVGRPPRSSSVPVRPPNQTLASTEAAPPPGPGAWRKSKVTVPRTPQSLPGWTSSPAIHVQSKSWILPFALVAKATSNRCVHRLFPSKRLCTRTEERGLTRVFRNNASLLAREKGGSTPSHVSPRSEETPTCVSL